VTLLILALFALVVLAPLALVLCGRQGVRSRRESALAIHRAQLAELDRDLAEGRLAPEDHAAAKLEVQRRLLAAADAPEPAPARANRRPVLAVLVLVPLLAAGLYAIDGHPFLPAAPLASRLAEAARSAQDAEALVAMLRTRLATLDQHSDLARQGYMLLGNSEDALGHLPDAVAAWRKALEIRFDPALAALVAEAQTRIEGKVSADSAALFRRALAEGPANAPWRKTAEQRLAEAGG
jgi:cytochrome c-type biogenesis protein CcmH